MSKFQGQTIVTEGCQISPLYSNGSDTVQTNNIPKGCLVYDSVGKTDGRTVQVTVANLSAQMIVIPPHTKLASVTAVQSTGQIQLKQKEDGIQVSLDRVIVAQQVQSEISDLEAEKNVNSSDSEKRQLYTFKDGSNYRLPTGLSLSLCNLTIDERDEVVRLIQKPIQPSQEMTLMWVYVLRYHTKYN